MKKRLRNVIPALALAALATGCASEDELTYGPQTAVTFTSAVTTRAAGTSWSRGDAIGVYMMPAGAALTDDNTGAVGGNVRYVTTAGDGRFEAAGEPLRFPAEGEVDFVAYYPWSALTTGATYRVDLTDQSDPEQIDLLYADNLRSQQAADGAGRLQFDHRLARLTLTLTSSDGSDLSRVKARLAGVPSGAWLRRQRPEPREGPAGGCALGGVVRPGDGAVCARRIHRHHRHAHAGQQQAAHGHGPARAHGYARRGLPRARRG